MLYLRKALQAFYLQASINKNQSVYNVLEYALREFAKTQGFKCPHRFPYAEISGKCLNCGESFEPWQVEQKITKKSTRKIESEIKR